MSQRVAKVESLVLQIVARDLVQELEKDAARVTVTRVDVTPDLRNATVWIGLLGDKEAQEKIWPEILKTVSKLQESVASNLKTKFVPRLRLKQDTGGEYAAKIEDLLRRTQ